MKLNVTQTRILAESIHQQIKDIVFAKELDGVVARDIKRFVDKAENLNKQLKELDKKRDELSKERKELIDNFNSNNDLSLWRSDTFTYETVTNSIKDKSVPKVDTIISNVTLKSLFSTDEELQDFINSIISKYTK